MNITGAEIGIYDAGPSVRVIRGETSPLILSHGPGTQATYGRWRSIRAPFTRGGHYYLPKPESYVRLLVALRPQTPDPPPAELQAYHDTLSKSGSR